MDIDKISGNIISCDSNDDLAMQVADKDQSHIEIELKPKEECETLSYRINEISDIKGKRISNKSYLLVAKHYPNYPRYSHKYDRIRRISKFTRGFAILPEIKGQTVNQNELGFARSKGLQENLPYQINTLQDLTKSILQYGGQSDLIWMKFPNIHNSQRLVRPGFSARRYMANLLQNLNNNLVEKLIADGKILETSIFKSSVILPHIRRRISADLSRYPEPYKILKQMLMSTGPLNEYSFVWKKPADINQDLSTQRPSEVKIGDIQILVKKNDVENNEIYEEVQYANMTRDKKKTVLSNLLLKSALTHAIKMKDQLMERNLKTDESSKDDTTNIHIPVINFDMTQAVTDLLNKETIETLSHNITSAMTTGGFRGQALRIDHHKVATHVELPKKVEEYQDMIKIVNVDSSISQDFESQIINQKIIPSLAIRLHPTNVEKLMSTKKLPKHVEVKSGQQSSLSNSTNSVITFNPTEHGLPDFQSQRETQYNAYVEQLKNKAAASTAPKETRMPYGKYKDSDVSEGDLDQAVVGDIDPSSSFQNWKYLDAPQSTTKSGKYLDSSSSMSAKQILSDSSNVSEFLHGPQLTEKDKGLKRKRNLVESRISTETDHSRITQLLREHAENVSENVLNNSGGQDFAADVNVAIREIWMQKKTLMNETNEFNEQIWNLDVQDMKNDKEYGEMVKHIFKSLFKDQMNGVTNEDVNISSEIIALLQEGLKLPMESIEIHVDPISGQNVVKLKEGIPFPSTTETGPLLTYDDKRVSSKSELKYQNITHSVSPFQHTGHIPPLVSSTTDSTSSSQYTKPMSQLFSSITHSTSPLQHTGPIPQPVYSLTIESVTEDNLVSLDLKEGMVSELEKKDSRTLRTKLPNVVLEDQENQSAPFPSEYNSVSVSQSGSRNSYQFGSSSTKPYVDEKERIERRSIQVNIPRVYPTEDVSIKSSSNLGPLKVNSEISSSPTKNNVQKSVPSKSNKEFITGYVDDIKDLKNLYSQPQEQSEKPKLKKQASKKAVAKQAKGKVSSKKKPKQETVKQKRDNIVETKQQTKPTSLFKSELQDNVQKSDSIIHATQEEYKTLMEKEDSGIPQIDENNNRNLNQSELPFTEDLYSEYVDDQSHDQLVEENESGDDEEAKERKRLMRQARDNKRNADAERRRLEVERRRKEKEEQRKLDIKRREMEEMMSKKYEDERRQKEEEYKTRMEKEKEEERMQLEAAKHEEYMKQKQIERERREKEEYNKRLEQIRLKQAQEDEQRRKEQERLAFEESERIRIENEMISRMRESERILFLQQRAEEEERMRLREEEEKRMKEEQARLALLEAQRILEQQARERALLEARLHFLKGLRIENEGLKKFNNITPTFIWSYFEFLKILGLEPNPTTNRLESSST